MTTSERFVLPGDLTIAPVDRFHSHARARLEASDGDVAIGRIGVRSSVKILSADAARLVEAFRAPTTIVDAVIAYARRESLDPEQTLREAYPILRGLIDARMLVSARSADAAGFEPSLAVGAYVGCFEITHCIQILEDTEVYRGRSADGDVAVKIARRGANANRRAALVREVDILRRLDGTANPRLLESGVFDGAPFLVIEWCDGGSVDALAAEYRSEAGRQDAHALFNLCCNVLAAYARLHAQGVVHGDVHPRNVVVARDGCVRVLDYDASRDRRVRGDSHDGRAGVAFFLEPEVARATLAGSPVPGPSFAGEQYALGVLLYLLVCGEHYLDLGYERERMLEQIANAPPLPFSRYGIVGWRQVERVLSVALRKSPDQRFAGVAAFAEALRTARVEVSDTCGPPAFARAARRTGAGILSGVLARAETTSFRSPTASVVAGAAGLAYALYRIAALRRDPRLLAAADVCATGIDTDRDDAYYDDEAELTPKEIGVVSPYVTATGVWVVRALIAKAMGNDAAVEEAVGAFVAAARGPCSNRDLYLGLASTLLGSALIQDVLTDRDRLAMDALRVFADDTMRRISAGIDALPAIGTEREVVSLGMAHGWAGILYALLRWCAAVGDPAPSSVVDRLDQLAVQAGSHGHGLRWEWRERGRTATHAPRYMAGWCNGSAGFVHLWTMAHAVFGCDRYAGLAEKAAWNTWREPLTRHADLCCGTAGRAYALLCVAKHTGEVEWLRRASKRAADAFAGITTSCVRRDSLYNGEVGVAVLAADHEQPDVAYMPFFEPAC